MGKNEMQRAWTIQTLAAWETLRERGVLYGDGRRVIKDWRSAYKWMMKQMKKRLSGYKGGWPIWAWVQWMGDSPRPDLRCSAHLPRGTHGVCLELFVDSDRLLLHDFDAWHSVLNDCYVSWNEKEWEEFCKKEESGDVSRREIQEEKELSWERIFDLNSSHRDPDWCGKPEEASIAAVMECVCLDDVVKVDHFVAR